MGTILWLIPVVPLASAACLMLFGRRLGKRASGGLGAGSVGVSALLSLYLLGLMLGAPAQTVLDQRLWPWLGTLGAGIAFRLDALSTVMIATVSVVAFFIHLYSIEHMAADDGFSRFFAYMNLFVASMLVLVLADNLLLLYLGWEGVGLCSYLLIGFWYRDPANGRAARKAFLVTRVGDTLMMVGLLVLYTSLDTLDIATSLERAPIAWPVGSPVAVTVALLLLGGAVGKSAQLPLQTWLPDAMAGPTPTSALIHAATMVTAGVYLIARMSVVFALAPAAQLIVAIVGAATLLLAGTSALFQRDIKRILAYSTMSQIGYMFLALGVGAWSASIFHLMTHACFKALLFLGAGVVIEAMHDEHDITKMGGLVRRVPLGFAAFVIGGAALAGLPLVTAGYYSKDLILADAGASGRSVLFWVAGMVGVFLTSLYIMRLIFYVFAGPARAEIESHTRWPVRSAIYVLAFLSVTAGFVNLGWSGRGPAFTRFVEAVLPAARRAPGGIGEHASALVSAALVLAGVLGAYGLFLRKRAAVEGWSRTRAGARLRDFWRADWGFDWLYERLFVAPTLWLARIAGSDVVDAAYTGLAAGTRSLNRALSRTESGRLRTYVAGVAAGAILLLGWVLWR